MAGRGSWAAFKLESLKDLQAWHDISRLESFRVEVIILKKSQSQIGTPGLVEAAPWLGGAGQRSRLRHP